jgi:PEGA domain
MNSRQTTMIGRTTTTLVSALAAVAVGGCATIVQSPRQQVSVASTPSGATVSIDHVERGKTPLVAELKRKDSHVLRIELAGYQPYEATLNRRVSGWVWGNIVFGGLIGLGVDALTGSMYKLNPEQVSAALTSGQAATHKNQDGVYVFAVLTPQPGWTRIGQLTPNPS